MKKAGVITMHRIYNYGSVLQTYATQVILENAGLQCEIIDYISPYRTKKTLFLEYPPRLEGKKLKRMIYYIAKVPSFGIKDLTFGGFIKKYLHLSHKRYITNQDLLANPPCADLYLSGSDQVWNSKYNHGVDGSYYLNFVGSSAKRFAFVSSFGREKLSEEEKKAVMPMFQQYDLISVREDAAVEILSDMGIQSLCLIDPTLQLKKSDWEQLASKCLVKEKYLLLFLLYNEDNGATKYAIKIAKKKGLKVVKLSWELKRPAGVDFLFTHRKPQDFLSLFEYADYVVTNSFHGVAFSINLNRQFVFVPRSEFNSRIESLLRVTGLTNRMMDPSKGEDPSQIWIDYKQVNHILEMEREKANRFVQKIVEDCGGKLDATTSIDYNANLSGK